jgi:hypothetical protein
MTELKIKKRSPDPKIPIKILFPESEANLLYTMAAIHKMTVNKYIVAVLLGHLGENTVYVKGCETKVDLDIRIEP